MSKTLILVAPHNPGNIFINAALKPFKLNPEKYQIAVYMDARQYTKDPKAMLGGFSDFAVQQIKTHKPNDVIVMGDVNLGFSGQDLNSLGPLVKEVISPALALSAFESKATVKPKIKTYGVIGGGPREHTGPISFIHNEKKMEITPTAFDTKAFQSGKSIDGIEFARKAVRSPSAPPTRTLANKSEETKKDNLPKMTAEPPKEVRRVTASSHQRTGSADSSLHTKKETVVPAKKARSGKLPTRSIFQSISPVQKDEKVADLTKRNKLSSSKNKAEP